MLTAGDWLEMAAGLAEVRGDNEVSIALRRGDATLEAQAVRIARMGGTGLERDSAGAQQAVGRVVVLGATSLDIEPGDRFNDGAGMLYEVVFVRPNRRAAVVAEARAVE